MSINLDDYEDFLARRPPTEGLSVAPWYAQLVERFRRLIEQLRELEDRDQMTDDWEWCVNRIREIQTRVLALEGARRRGSKNTYDPRCYDLAAIFLGDEPRLHTPENTDQLARLIQQAIEDYIAVMRPDDEAAQ